MRESSQAPRLTNRALAHLHAKDQLDRSSREDDLPQTKCIEALAKVVDFLHWSYEAGDAELGTNLPLYQYVR